MINSWRRDPCIVTKLKKIAHGSCAGLFRGQFGEKRGSLVQLSRSFGGQAYTFASEVGGLFMKVFAAVVLSGATTGIRWGLPARSGFATAERSP